MIIPAIALSFLSSLSSRKPGIRSRGRALARTMAWLGLAVGMLAALCGAVPAEADEPRAVIELFTSQGCSSCPAADRLLGEFAKDDSLIVLTLPIDYWDYLGWKDTLADPRWTARQRAYSQMRGDRNVYTPQAVINGGAQVIGSDRGEIEQAIATKTPDTALGIPVSLSQTGGQINVRVAAAPAARPARGEVWICAVSKRVAIAIGRGENRGREVTYHNVVRQWLKVGDFNGAATSWTVPIENVARDGVDAAVVLVQDGSRDRPGPMLGAAMTNLR